MNNDQKCQSCSSGVLARGTAKETYFYNDQSIEVEISGYYCNLCGKGVFTKADLKEKERILNTWEAQIDGFLSPSEVRRVRKRLGLTQHEAAKIFGGGPNAFSRYERGEALQLRSTDNLLRLLDRYPHLLDELRSGPPEIQSGFEYTAKPHSSAVAQDASRN